MKTAEERADWRARRGDEVVQCEMCGTDGIPEWFSEDGDEEYTEILQPYHDSGCRYDGDMLCQDCSNEMDVKMTNISEESARKWQYARRTA